MNWGKSIALFYGLFVVALLAVVAFAFTQDVNLVSDDYYQQELVYEDQINRIKNTENLEEKPSLMLKGSYVELAFPAALAPKGTLLFFRPSNSKLDRRIAISLGADHKQQIDFSQQEKGLWKAKLNWKQDGKEYYQEFIIVK
ncbi:MAG: FixH family protein [Cyclobacteriaceae bacterium]|nr:FixH family protein [Cyclobacteriaceae bacterium]